MVARFRFDGSWRAATDIRIRAEGQWRRVQEIRKRIDGSWRSVFVYDTTGPGAVRTAKAEWSNSSGARCVVSWQQPSATDTAYTDLYVNRTGSSTGPWTYISRYTGGPASTFSYVDTSVTLTAYTIHGNNQASPVHYYRFIPFDERGNQGTISIVGSSGQGNTVVRGYVTSPYYTVARSSKTWRTNDGWRNDSVVQDAIGAYERAVQGSTTVGQNYGFYFYSDGTVPGLNITAASVYLARQNGGTGSGIQARMRMSAATASMVSSNTTPVNAATSAETLSNAFATPANGGTRAGFSSVPFDYPLGIANNTYRSLRIFTGEATTSSGVSANYSVWSSRNEDGVGFDYGPGTLRVYHTG
jgi:hypothetical protein